MAGIDAEAAGQNRREPQRGGQPYSENQAKAKGVLFVLQAIIKRRVPLGDLVVLDGDGQRFARADEDDQLLGPGHGRV